MSSGRLEKAVIQNLETGEAFSVQFNPAMYELAKKVSWKEQSVAGRDAPRVEFTTGGRRRLTMSLVFDTTDQGGDVRSLTSRIEGLALVESSLPTPRPPRLLFRWGGFELRCVLESCVSRYLLFGEDGVPLRAELKVAFGEYAEDSEQGAGAGSGSATASEEVVVGADERLDQVADRVYGSPEHWTALAEANDLEDPLDVPAGTALEAPPLEGSR